MKTQQRALPCFSLSQLAELFIYEQEKKWKSFIFANKKKLPAVATEA